MPDRPWGRGIGAARRLVGTAAAVAVLAGAVPASAGVKTSMSTRYYSVGGTTAASLVSYMRAHPIRGDYGNAIANIRPSYSLSVVTRPASGVCRASDVTLRLHLSLTLPKARNTSSMSSSTRSAWNAFAAYARQHELTHRSIYVRCANAFVAQALRMSAGNCSALKASIYRLLESEKRSCEAQQRAFDRGEQGRAANMSLFWMARSLSRR